MHPDRPDHAPTVHPGLQTTPTGRGLILDTEHGCVDTTTTQSPLHHTSRAGRSQHTTAPLHHTSRAGHHCKHHTSPARCRSSTRPVGAAFTAYSPCAGGVFTRTGSQQQTATAAAAAAAAAAVGQAVTGRDAVV